MGRRAARAQIQRRGGWRQSRDAAARQRGSPASISASGRIGRFPEPWTGGSLTAMEHIRVAELTGSHSRLVVQADASGPGSWPLPPSTKATA